MGERVNILFTSSGRRVSLVESFRSSLNELGVLGKTFTADVKKSAPTAFISDEHFLVPKVNSETYIESLLKICKENKIRLLIPLIDPELSLLAQSKESFLEIGTEVVVSSKDVCEICFNKNNTMRFFKENNIRFPVTYDTEDLDLSSLSYPLFIKPAYGSCSIGASKVSDLNELKHFLEYTDNPVLQDFIDGEEYTVDVFVWGGKVRCSVPRLRLEVRAGEVSKGVTVKDEDIMRQAEEIVSQLVGAKGVITLQCFKEKRTGRIYFIEINPRFGGGVPLSIKAEADFPRWIIQSVLNNSLPENMNDKWKENVAMLRYDEAIFTDFENINE